MPNTTTFIAPGAVPGTVPGGGWMPVVSLWNESSDPFVSNAKRAAIISVGPPSLCAAGYACGAGSPAKTGIGTLHLLKGTVLKGVLRLRVGCHFIHSRVYSGTQWHCDEGLIPVRFRHVSFVRIF